MTKVKEVFEWGEPPRSSRNLQDAGQYKRVNALAKKVASRPMTWVCILEAPKYSIACVRASQIRRGRLRGWSDVGLFEARVGVIVPDSKWGVWVRFMGDPGAGDSETFPEVTS
jgi:hypothetical protein